MTVQKLVIYATSPTPRYLSLSYYDENWVLYALQYRKSSGMDFLVVGMKGSAADDAVIDWLPYNWCIA